MDLYTVIIVGLAISAIQDQETNVSIAVLRVLSKSQNENHNKSDTATAPFALRATEIRSTMEVLTTSIV